MVDTYASLDTWSDPIYMPIILFNRSDRYSIPFIVKTFRFQILRLKLLSHAIALCSHVTAHHLVLASLKLKVSYDYLIL
jgi:hypothetical protein